MVHSTEKKISTKFLPANRFGSLFFILTLLLVSCGKSEEDKMAVIKKSFMEGCLGANEPSLKEGFQEKYCPCAWDVISQDKVCKEKILSGGADGDVDKFLKERMEDSTFSNSLTRCVINSMEK